MGKQIKLSYWSTEATIEFCRLNPIVWASREQKKLINGAGNIKTPTPALEVFFELLQERGELFCQFEYHRIALIKWYDEFLSWAKPVRYGVGWRLWHNFYPSAVDSLHVWAMLVETGEFDRCILDVADDTKGKTDVTVWHKEEGPVKIALHTDSPENRKWTKHKRKYRGAIPEGIVDIILPMDRPKGIGNKRWYKISDLKPIFDRCNVRADFGAHQDDRDRKLQPITPRDGNPIVDRLDLPDKLKRTKKNEPEYLF